MELIDLIPNSMSFRVVTTIDVHDGDEIPVGFTGRIKHHDEDNSVVAVSWYADGQLHNPGKHHPAFRRFRHDGRLKYEMFYTHGLLHDPSDHLPAVRGYYADGKVHYEERYFGGKRNDGKDGAAAIRKWRSDGTLRHELHYQQGRRVVEGQPEAPAAPKSNAGRPAARPPAPPRAQGPKPPTTRPT
jgi:antitoxin component YwqK of YwqJK toxin-antitoxin module